APPTASSPLSPYTTLFRSGAAHGHPAARDRGGGRREGKARGPPQAAHHGAERVSQPGRGTSGPRASPREPGWFAADHRAFAATRSEEHTSELQSRENLVCR